MERFSFLLTGFLLVLLAAPVLALQVLAPAHFSVLQVQNTLEATVRNNSNDELPLQISLFAPARTQILAPERVPGNGEATIRIVFNNYPFLQNTTYETRLLAMLGNETANRKILVSFQKPAEETEPTPDSEQPAPGQSPLNGIATGFFVFLGATNFELALQILLGLLIIVLCIALTARLYNRAKGEKA